MLGLLSGRPISESIAAPHFAPTIANCMITTANTSLPSAVNCPAHATPHTKATTFTTIVAATTADYWGFTWYHTNATGTAATDTSSLIDIAIGAASSEVVIVPNLGAGYHSGVQQNFVPIFIPKGSRISGRAQSAVGSKNIAMVIWGFARANGMWRLPTRMVDMGTNLAASRGVILTAPGANNTKSTPTEIVASTPEHIRYIMMQLQGASDADLVAQVQMHDIMIGSAGNEVVLVANANAAPTTAEVVNHVNVAWGAWEVNVPKGSRLSVRYQANTAATTATQNDAILYGAS